MYKGVHAMRGNSSSMAARLKKVSSRTADAAIKSGLAICPHQRVTQSRFSVAGILPPAKEAAGSRQDASEAVRAILVEKLEGLFRQKSWRKRGGDEKDDVNTLTTTHHVLVKHAHIRTQTIPTQTRTHHSNTTHTHARTHQAQHENKKHFVRVVIPVRELNSGGASVVTRWRTGWCAPTPSPSCSTPSRSSTRTRPTRRRTTCCRSSLTSSWCVDLLWLLGFLCRV